MSLAGGPDRPARVLLGLASVAVAFAAADTYVVVLALPDMMAASGLSADELHRAAPIVSGFLLGYVAVLPLIGRIADLRGRLPVLVGSLVVFALGSLVTAAAYDLSSMVVGRFLQGMGGGGLVPATLALVADIYPARRRGVPLGVVGAVQELGSVAGPLYGAVVLAFGSWRAIFWVNLAVGLGLAAVLRSSRSPASAGVVAGASRPRESRDRLSGVLVVGTLLALLLVMLQPRSLSRGITTGLAFVPVVGESRWLSPLALVTMTTAVLFLVRSATARSPLLDLKGWAGVARQVDVLGASLLSLSLAGIIVAFASADPEVQVFSAAGPWLLGFSALSAVAFWFRNRATAHPLVPPAALRARPAWGALVVSFFIGSALVAALVDIPIFARVTVHGDSQLSAALVLVRFLVGLPAGAVAGGWLSQRLPVGVVTAGGMALACAGFVQMSGWGLETLESDWSTVPLVLAGLGFGLALAPVNAALLAATEETVHGVASALLVVARMVGMLVGISVLTTAGLRRYYSAQGDLPAPMEVCGDGVSRCEEFTLLLRETGLTQLQTVFLGAGVCCAVAGLLALLLLQSTEARGVRPRPSG